MELREALANRERDVLEQITSCRDQLRPLEIELAEVRRAKAAIGQSNMPLAPQMSYAALTMKELVVKALSEHFHEGATIRQMLEFFRDAWGRDISRTNLSPQISRLYREGIVGRASGTSVWHLNRDMG